MRPGGPPLERQHVGQHRSWNGWARILIRPLAQRMGGNLTVAACERTRLRTALKIAR